MIKVFLKQAIVFFSVLFGTAQFNDVLLMYFFSALVLTVLAIPKLSLAKFVGCKPRKEIISTYVIFSAIWYTLIGIAIYFLDFWESGFSFYPLLYFVVVESVSLLVYYQKREYTNEDTYSIQQEVVISGGVLLIFVVVLPFLILGLETVTNINETIGSYEGTINISVLLFFVLLSTIGDILIRREIDKRKGNYSHLEDKPLTVDDTYIAEESGLVIRYEQNDKKNNGGKTIRVELTAANNVVNPITGNNCIYYAYELYDYHADKRNVFLFGYGVAEGISYKKVNDTNSQPISINKHIILDITKHLMPYYVYRVFNVEMFQRLYAYICSRKVHSAKLEEVKKYTIGSAQLDEGNLSTDLFKILEQLEFTSEYKDYINLNFPDYQNYLKGKREEIDIRGLKIQFFEIGEGDKRFIVV